MIIEQGGLRGDGNLFGKSPHKPNPLTGNGHDHLVGVFAACAQLSRAFTEPHLGLPADVLDGFGVLFQSELEMPADFSRIAIRPSAFHQGAMSMGVASFGNRTLSASLASGVFRGNQTQEVHQFSGVIEAGEVAEFGHHGDSHGELHAVPGLVRVDHMAQATRCDPLLEFLFETLEAFGVFVDGTDVFLTDHLLSRGRTDDLREPPERGRATGGPARIAAIVAEPAGVAAKLGRLELAAGIFPGSGAVADRFVFNRGDSDGGESPRAREAGQWHRVTAVGVDWSPAFFGIRDGATTQQLWPFLVRYR